MSQFVVRNTASRATTCTSTLEGVGERNRLASTQVTLFVSSSNAVPGTGFPSPLSMQELPPRPAVCIQNRDALIRTCILEAPLSLLYGCTTSLSPDIIVLLNVTVMLFPALLQPDSVGPLANPAIPYATTAPAWANRSPTGFLSRGWMGPCQAK